jgi:hypothetical protein
MIQLVSSQMFDASSDDYAAPRGVKEQSLVNGKIKLYKKHVNNYNTITQCDKTEDGDRALLPSYKTEM